jgi:putative spermidine/putrescine transport system substrate-binding protein
MRSFLSAAAAAALLLAGEAGARDLYVVGFGGAPQDNFRKHLFEGYAKAANVPVKDDVYNGEMAKIYAMVQAKNVTWDVMIVEAPELARGCEDGVFEKIDYAVVDKNKFIANAVTDCGVASTSWGAIMFHSSRNFPDGPKNYADMWNLEKFPGKRSLRWGPKMTLEIALLADGVPRADVYKVLRTPEGVNRAFAKLDKIKPQIVWWRSGAQPLQFVGSGEVAIATAYTNRVVNAQKERPDYRYTWDGMMWSFDSWAVVKGSPHRAEAMKMIQWMTGEEPLLNLLKDWPQAGANKNVIERAKTMQPTLVTSNVEHGLFISTEFWVDKGEELEKRFATWAAQ